MDLFTVAVMAAVALAKAGGAASEFVGQYFPASEASPILYPAHITIWVTVVHGHQSPVTEALAAVAS